MYNGTGHRAQGTLLTFSKAVLFALLFAASFVAPAWALSGSGTSNAPYLIGSTADWKAFVTMLTTDAT